MANALHDFPAKRFALGRLALKYVGGTFRSFDFRFDL